MQPMENHPKELQNPPPVDVENVAASTDCTGLIPAALTGEGQAEAYEELLPMHPKKARPS